MKQLKTYFLFVGILGILLSTFIGVQSQLNVFLHPVDYWIHHHLDPFWAIVFSILIIFTLCTFWIRGGKFLIICLISCTCLLFVLPMIFGGLGIDFLVGSWFLVVAIGTGRLLINLIVPAVQASTMERMILNATLGCGVIALLSLVMGIMHWWTATRAYIVLIILSLISLPGLVKELWQKYSNKSLELWNAFWQVDLRIPALTLGLIWICALGAYIWSLAPAIRWDSLSYHIAAPEIYIRNKALIEIPESFNTYWAHYAEMLYTYVMLLAGQPLPGMLHLAAGLLTTLLTFLIGKRLAGTHVGLMGAVLFISMPIVGFETGTTYVDLFVAMFITAAIYTGVVWFKSDQKNWLVLTGVMSGFALGVKINSFLLLLPLWILLTIGFVYRYRSFLLVGRCFLYLFFPAALIYLPWPIRDYWWTGNPIFPMYNSLFDSPKWFAPRSLWQVQPPSINMFVSLIRLPWDMVMDSRRFYHEGPGGMLGALPLLALPWLYWHPTLSKQTRLYSMYFGIYTLLVISIFSLVSYNARYLISLFPIAAICGALNLQVIAINLKPKKNRGKPIFQVSVVLLLVGGYVFSTRLASIMRIAEFPERYPYKVVFGIESVEAFLDRAIPVYRVYQYLNTHVPDAKVLSIGSEFRLYTTARIYGLLFSPQTRLELQALEGEDELARFLTQEKFEYILYYPAEQRSRPAVYNIRSLTQEFLGRYTNLVFVHNNIRLYKFCPEGESQAPDIDNYLINPGFEAGFDEGILLGWNEQGSPELVPNQSFAHRGHFSLEIYGANSPKGYSYVHQDLQIVPGALYTAGYWISGSPNSALQLQLEWLDADHHTIDIQYEWAGLTEEWQYFDLIAYAPEQAAYARFYASITGAGTAWIDDLCFTRSYRCP